MSEYGAAAAADVASVILNRAGGAPPESAIILGSGLGVAADELDASTVLPYAEIPGYPSTTVAGHGGRLVLGMLAGRRVAAFDGRFHLYEGRGTALSAFPVRVAHALGARTLIVTNAAGGIREDLQPGDLMVIEDHINFTFANPLIGHVEPGDERFPDMSAPYDRGLAQSLLTAARATTARTTSGVYAGVTGPSYETRAEVRALATLGADAVGMSTVPEVIVARALGLRVGGIALITNRAAGGSLSHEDVVATAERGAKAILTASNSR